MKWDQSEFEDSIIHVFAILGEWIILYMWAYEAILDILSTAKSLFIMRVFRLSSSILW